MISVAPDALPSPAALPLPPLTRFVKRASVAIGIDGEVDILLTSDAELRRLNRRFRGKNKATDVLSFPTETMPGLPEACRHAGDLAISLHTAARQAAAHGHTLATEVRVLLLHGLLHLAGMDHETDKGEMRERESSLRGDLRLPTSLIARSMPFPVVRQATPQPVRRLKGASVASTKAVVPCAVATAKRDPR